MARVYVLINIASQALIDYEPRLNNKNINESETLQAKVSFILEVVSTIGFTSEIIINISVYGLFKNKDSYLRNWMNVVNFISVIAR